MFCYYTRSLFRLEKVYKYALRANVISKELEIPDMHTKLINFSSQLILHNRMCNHWEKSYD